MAAFALTGLVVLSYLPTVHEASAPVQFYMGVLAIFAFIFALAGSASAIRRWSVLLSVIGASLVALWGLLENWYALTWLFILGDLTAWTDIQTAVTLGTLALFLSMLVIIMVVAARKEFKPYALSRASLE